MRTKTAIWFDVVQVPSLCSSTFYFVCPFGPTVWFSLRFLFFFGVMFLTVPACPTTAAVSTLQGTNFLIAFQKFYSDGSSPPSSEITPAAAAAHSVGLM